MKENKNSKNTKNRQKNSNNAVNSVATNSFDLEKHSLDRAMRPEEIGFALKRRGPF